MEETKKPSSELHLTCSFCLKNLSSPVSLHCGHNFCRSCIEDHWNKSTVYHCYDCKKEFGTRPSLRQNDLLTNLLQEFQNRELSSDQHEMKQTAAQAAADADYKRPLYTSKKGKQKKSTQDLHHHMCTKHQRPVEFFCRTDQMCICFECTENEHQRHDKVTVDRGRDELQPLVENTFQKIEEMVQEKEKRVAKMKENITDMKTSLKRESEDYQNTLSSLLQCIERLRHQVSEEFRSHEQKEVNKAEEYIKQVEQEIKDLRQREDELDELSKTEDHILFLEKFPSFHIPTVVGDTPDINDKGGLFSQNKEKELLLLEKHIQKISSWDIVKTKKKETCHVSLQTDQENKDLKASGSSEAGPQHANVVPYGKTDTKNLGKRAIDRTETSTPEVKRMRKEEEEAHSSGIPLWDWFSKKSSPVLGKDKVTIEVEGLEKTFQSGKTFIKNLIKKMNDSEIDIYQGVFDSQSSNLALLFCPVASRIGTDINVALKKIPNNKKAILVVMHHTPNPAYIVAESARLVKQKNVVGTVDLLFHESIGLLECQLNEQSLEKVFIFCKDHCMK
ncbi:tripartite motif-containing protein 65-like isoform X1 [Erpetoichthys calabaricus]|uniref:tripartite motif-containing protein 65-like isoform X1 n=1 Tax=Erpetoichthys calabaricus TaxID=27687 RepID=UPI0022346CD1|nr:tripartite motif-containing protein 65-like isoform X1 [Erpetoichthys calabaricus]